jgi:hypothetical protein
MHRALYREIQARFPELGWEAPQFKLIRRKLPAGGLAIATPAPVQPAPIVAITGIGITTIPTPTLNHTVGNNGANLLAIAPPDAKSGSSKQKFQYVSNFRSLPVLTKVRTFLELLVGENIFADYILLGSVASCIEISLRCKFK